jgi:chloramphenicol-sensitive protein RarD
MRDNICSGSEYRMGRIDFERGFLAALAALVSWGLLPIYWKQLEGLAPLQILCHRIIWSLLFVMLIITMQKKWGAVRKTFKSPKLILLLMISGLTIGANWFVYIWAVNSDRVIEASLGYYVNPLVSVFLGVIFLKEKLGSLQWMAIFLATAAILYQIIHIGVVPLAALSLAFTFGFYGLIRKIAEVESLVGLFIETLFLILPASFYLFVYLSDVPFLAGQTSMQNIWLIGTGVITSLPLIGFAYGARRLPLSFLGIMQYIPPTLSFLLGYFLYKEPFTMPQFITFICVWIALVMFTVDNVRQWRKIQRSNRRVV